jgi:hypothetical protein
MGMQQELPDFAVPAQYRLETELTAPLPRPVPDSLRHHPQRVASRRTSWRVSTVFALLCALGLIFQKSTFMHILGLYFTPFAYFWWVGWVGLAFSVWGMLHFWYPGKKDPFLYLRHGVPLTVRVVDMKLEVATRVNGSDATFAYDVYVDFPDPRSGEMSYSVLRSAAIGKGSARLRCRVGDYLTALYLPGMAESSLVLYGFTGINPDQDLLVRENKKAPWLAGLASLAGLVAFCWGLACYPLRSSQEAQALWLVVPIVLVAMVLGWMQHKKTLRRMEEEYQSALASGDAMPGETFTRPKLIGSLFLGLMAGLFVGFGGVLWVNGALDFGKTQEEAVRVTGVTQTTYQGLFCSYSAKYIDPVTGKSESLGISPILLEDADEAHLVTHPGALGMPWQELRLIRSE